MKEHIAAAQYADVWVAHCGSIDRLDKKMHASLEQLTAAQRANACLACLKGLNSYDSWKLYWELKKERIDRQ